jgi:hypothetical protein
MCLTSQPSRDEAQTALDEAVKCKQSSSRWQGQASQASGQQQTVDGTRQQDVDGNRQQNVDEVPALTRSDINCQVDEHSEKLIKTLNEYRDVIATRGELLSGVSSVEKHEIKLRDDKSPPINVVPYRIPHKYKEELEMVTEKMLREKTIEPSMSDWNFPVIVVKKKGGTIRPVIDLRQLNKSVLIQSWPLPRVDEMLSALGGCTIFSLLDLRSAYHQIELEEN